MFSFPREMEVSVSMKNGHKCIFLTWKKNIRYLKWKISDTKDYLNDIDEHYSQMYVTVYLHIWNV